MKRRVSKTKGIWQPTWRHIDSRVGQVWTCWYEPWRKFTFLVVADPIPRLDSGSIYARGVIHRVMNLTSGKCEDIVEEVRDQWLRAPMRRLA